MQDNLPIGIAGIGTYIPSAHITGAEIARRSGLPETVVVEKMGLKRKSVAGPGDHTNQMGLWAAQQAISQAGVEPNEIDLVICTTEEWKEHFLWVAGIKMAYDLGARRAWAIDVGLKCATSLAALKIAKDMMLADRAINTVLVAGGYRNGDFVDYANPRTRFMYNLAAGGGAFLLKKGLAKNLVLESAIRVDGAFSEDVITGAGGTIRPLTPELLAAGAQNLDVPDPEGMKERLDARSMRNFVGVVRDSLAMSGYTQKDLDYLAILHMKRSAHDHVLAELGLRHEQAVYLEDYGHIGQQDQALSLQLAQQQGRLKDGDIVTLVGAGIGYAWGATTVRWGSVES